MSAINHIFEPSRLLLVWHHSGNSTPRHRRTVGELFKNGNSICFRYLKESDDYQLAQAEGFIGFPAFTATNTQDKFDDALEVFTKRLPPSKRADFPKYLAQYGLPYPFNGSDFALLAYTGARLASDSFELCPDLSDATAPIDLIAEISGAHYHIKERGIPPTGAEVSLLIDIENPYDRNAIAAIVAGEKIGYINKSIAGSLKKLIENSSISCNILKSISNNEKIQISLLVRAR